MTRVKTMLGEERGGKQVAVIAARGGFSNDWFDYSRIWEGSVAKKYTELLLIKTCQPAEEEQGSKGDRMIGGLRHALSSVIFRSGRQIGSPANKLGNKQRCLIKAMD